MPYLTNAEEDRRARCFWVVHRQRASKKKLEIKLFILYAVMGLSLIAAAIF